MRRTAAALLFPLFVASVALAAPPRASGAHTPDDVVRQVAGAYEHCALPELDAVLSADFQFDFTIDFTVGTRTSGSSIYPGDRAKEMRLAARTIGFTSYYRAHHMNAYGAFVTIGAIEEGIDPEHADSTCQYRLLAVRDFRIHFVRPGGYREEDIVLDYLRGLQVLHVARGDVAACMPGQPADSAHWYARRWIQDVDALTLELGRLDGECGGDLPVSTPRGLAPPILALRAVNAPLCPTLQVICDLPGPESAQLEVYDVQGRRMAKRTVSPSSTGSVLVEAGNGIRFSPGVYWVRLHQGSRPAAVKLVLVAL